MHVASHCLLVPLRVYPQDFISWQFHRVGYPPTQRSIEWQAPCLLYPQLHHVIIQKLSKPCNPALPSRFWTLKSLGWPQSSSLPFSVTIGQDLGVLYFILLGFFLGGWGRLWINNKKACKKLNPNITRQCRRIWLLLLSLTLILQIYMTCLTWAWPWRYKSK